VLELLLELCLQNPRTTFLTGLSMHKDYFLDYSLLHPHQERYQISKDKNKLLIQEDKGSMEKKYYKKKKNRKMKCLFNRFKKNNK
jgi:hypothetical protein